MSHGHARRSPRPGWGGPWHLRSVPGLSLADPGHLEGYLGGSLGVLRGLLGELLGVPCAWLAVFVGPSGCFGRLLELFKTIGFCDGFAPPWEVPSPWKVLGSSSGAFRAPCGPFGRRESSSQTAFRRHQASRGNNADRLAWHGRSWASTVDVKAALRSGFLRKCVQIQQKPMVFLMFL